jgi:hypothetical protein
MQITGAIAVRQPEIGLLSVALKVARFTPATCNANNSKPLQAGAGIDLARITRRSWPESSPAKVVASTGCSQASPEDHPSLSPIPLSAPLLTNANRAKLYSEGTERSIPSSGSGKSAHA